MSSRKAIRFFALVVCLFALIVGVAHLLYGQVFFNAPGLGHDYGYFFPELLSNYYSIKSQGFSPPWFTPAFCGGIPAFPDPQSVFYSLPQFLVLFVNPVLAVYLTLIIFTVLGFAGMYSLLRTSFALSPPASIVGASLFALNGFFAHRMLIGHLTFHGAMLIPWMALALTKPDNVHSSRASNSLLWGSISALIFAYWIGSGMAVLILPAALAVGYLVLLHHSISEYTHQETLRYRILVTLTFGLALTASKIAATFAYIRHFPRADYAISGIPGTWETIKFSFYALFFGPQSITSLTQEALNYSRHEFEFSLTLVPLVLIPFGLLIFTLKYLRDSQNAGVIIKRCRKWSTAILVISLLIPIVLNTSYGPRWADFLKTIPIIRSSSTLLRWLLAYIPIVTIITALAFDQITNSTRLRRLLACMSFLAIAALHAGQDLKYYYTQPYDPKPISNAFDDARTLPHPPSVKYVAYNAYPDGKIAFSINRNDLLAQGASQLFCYNALFGYGLEHFPQGTLQPGMALAENDGVINFKNPACYVFPDENKCQPGDHFSSSQIEDAKLFLAYRTFIFKQSTIQIVANWISTISILALPAFFVPFFRSRGRAKNTISLKHSS